MTMVHNCQSMLTCFEQKWNNTVEKGWKLLINAPKDHKVVYQGILQQCKKVRKQNNSILWKPREYPASDRYWISPYSVTVYSSRVHTTKTTATVGGSLPEGSQLKGSWARPALQGAIREATTDHHNNVLVSRKICTLFRLVFFTRTYEAFLKIFPVNPVIWLQSTNLDMWGTLRN